MFDFGNANDGQRQAISTTEGPVLITAGPGTGKTYTLVQRAIYLIEERGVKPEDIFIATFTEKAAKELITRITNELASRNITVNVNEMYVGTFHSLLLASGSIMRLISLSACISLNCWTLFLLS